MAQKFAEGMKGGAPPWKEGEKIDLKVVHWCIYAPHVSGMYETVRELILAENQVEGVLAGMCETPNPKASPAVVKKAAQGGKVDPFHSELRTQDWGWGMKWADIHVIHSTMSNKVAELEPKAFFAHGTPEACLHNELQRGDTRQSFSSTARWVDRFEASFVTSERAERNWGAFDHTNERVHRVDKGIDLTWWTRASAPMDLEGEPSVLYGEIWRNIKHPLHLFHAMAEIFKENKAVRLNSWGCNIKKPFWLDLVKMAYWDEFLGKYGIRGIEDYPSKWYSRGDVYFGAALFGDLSRSMEEAMACGCPMITWDTDPYGDCHAYRYAKAFDIDDLVAKITEVYGEVADNREGVAKKCRNIAEKYFDVNNEARQVVKVLRQVVASR